MMLRIPTSNAPFYDQTTDLDGTSYIFRFTYNHRQDRWNFDLLTVDLVPIVTGIRVVTDIGLLRRYHHLPVPPGEIVCLSYDAADDGPPGLEDLVTGGRCELLYVSAAELAGAL